MRPTKRDRKLVFWSFIVGIWHPEVRQRRGRFAADTLARDILSRVETGCEDEWSALAAIKSDDVLWDLADDTARLYVERRNAWLACMAQE